MKDRVPLSWSEFGCRSHAVLHMWYQVCPESSTSPTPRYPASATRRPDPPIGLALTLPALQAVRVRLLGLR